MGGGGIAWFVMLQTLLVERGIAWFVMLQTLLAGEEVNRFCNVTNSASGGGGKSRLVMFVIILT